MSIIKKINITKVSLVVSFAAFFVAMGSIGTPCKAYASSGVCDTGDTLVTNTLQVQSGTAFKSTLDASGITADRNVVLLDEDSQTVPDSSGASSGDVLTAGVGGATSWAAPAAGGSFSSTYAKLRYISNAANGTANWTQEDYDLCSPAPGCVATGTGNYVVATGQTGYYAVNFAGNQAAPAGSLNIQIQVAGVTVNSCRTQPAPSAAAFINCTGVVYATAGDTISGYYYSSNAADPANFGGGDSWLEVYRLD